MKDICFCLDQSGKEFYLINSMYNTMPDIVKAAITLMFFSNIQSMRPFDGEGIYGLLTKVTTGAAGYLQSNLSILGTELRRILSKIYPELVNLELTYDLDGSMLIVNINITTNTDSFTETIYQQSLQ